MANIVLANNLNATSLTDPDVYVEIVQPPPYTQGVPTDVIGVVGTASWGPVNQPVHLGSGQDATGAFGSISAAALTDPYDLATDLFLAFGQASSTASLEGWAVRVTDGTDVAATLALSGTANAATESFTIGGSPTTGDVLTVTAANPLLAGSPVSVSYSIPAGSTLASVASGLALAIRSNATLAGANVWAAASNAVVNVYLPAWLATPHWGIAPISWNTALSAGASESITAGSGSNTSIGGLVQALYTGSLGNQIVLSVTNGVFSNTYNVTVSGFSGLSERFIGLPAVNFWGALQNALASGQNSIRGPSSWVRLTGANAAVGAPTLGLYGLIGGTDGRVNVTLSEMVGSQSSVPQTGLWALQNMTPPVGIAWLTGVTDISAVASLVAFDQTAGASVLFPFPTGTSTTAAVGLVQSIGEADPGLLYCKDWIYFLDTYNNMRRLVPPTAVIGGTWTTLSPEQSPLNKPVRLVLGTERVDPVNGTLPYSASEIGQLQSAGVLLITNPIPAGSQFGIRTGASTSTNSATRPAEWYRLTMFVARSVDGVLGQFIGALQSQQANDPLREQVESLLNDFSQTLIANNQIDSGRGYCQFSKTGTAGSGVNTPTSISQHYLYALLKMRYLSSVWYFICAIEGGTTVVTVQQAQSTS